MITLDQLQAIAPRASAVYVEPLSGAMTAFLINTRKRQAAFLAQIAHESAGFTRVVESTYYTRADRLLALFPRDFRDLDDAARYVKNPQACASRIYANQNGNGPESSGDGWRYRGRGLIQITGRSNYRRCSIGLFNYPSRLLTEPELLEQPRYAAQSAAWYWSDSGCNELADAGLFQAITRAINGGLNGYSDRLAYWERGKEVLT